MSHANDASPAHVDQSTTPDAAAGADVETTLNATRSNSVPPSHLALLHRAALAFNSTLDLNSVLHSVLEELSRALRADGWAVWLMDPTAGEIECVQSEGPFSAKLLGQRANPDEGALSWVIRHGRSINLARPTEDARYNDAVTRRAGTPLGSLLCAPLKGRGPGVPRDEASTPPPTFGAISVTSQQAAAFDDEDLAVLEALTATAAGAIENAQLYSRASKEIEERRRAERALRYSENQYRTMAETSPDSIVVTDLDGIITNCNMRTLELHGYEQRSDILGRGVLMLFAPQCRAEVLEMHRDILEGDATHERELMLLRRDETTRTVMYAASLVAGEDGNPLSIIGFSRDISDRRAAEDAIRRHNQELRILNRIATQTGQVRDLHSLLDTVLQLILDVLEVDTGCAVLFDEPIGSWSQTRLDVLDNAEPATPAQPEDVLDVLQEWLGARLRESRRPISINVRDLPFHWAVTATESHIHAVPLVVQDQVAGMLAVAELRDGRPHPIRPQQRQLLSAIGHQISVAVDNARLTAKVAEMDMLRELTRIRSELLAAFSHDLRTPLGLIHMACSTLQRDDIALDDLLVADLLDDIETQTERLSRLVDGILDLDHLESRHLRLDLVDLDMAALIQQLASETERAHPMFQVKVLTEPGPLVAWADPGRIDQVVRNLLDNAVKYTPQAGEIVAHISRKEHVVRVSISDHGIGIPEDQREMVFERFYRVGGPPTQGIPGTGLGLATCRSIIEAHGGRIWVESESPSHGDTGTTLTFTLPAPPLDSPSQMGSAMGHPRPDVAEAPPDSPSPAGASRGRR